MIIGEIMSNLDKETENMIKKRLKEGWIKAWFAIEVLAITKDAAESSLEKHVEKISNEKDVHIYSKEFKDTEEVPNPFKKEGTAYSRVVEVELLVSRFEHLVYIVMNYAPTSIEILEPTELKIKLPEAQLILNSVAEMIHSFVISQRNAVTIDT